MKLLTPLGLLGLLGVVVLILIYILKPNYMQRRVSSTFVWKLSLKYRKKKIPISKLRNILIIICQVLILTSCAFILATPSEQVAEKIDSPEVVAVLDSSASMRSEINNETRFKRAIDDLLLDADDIFSRNGKISVILADTEPIPLLDDVTVERRADLELRLQALLDEDACSYGTANIDGLDGAISKCKEKIEKNPSAQIYLYTDTTYEYVPDFIKVRNVCDNGEFNFGILDAYTQMEENYYAIYVKIACYGKEDNVQLKADVINANLTDDGSTQIELNTTVDCTFGAEKTVIFKYFTAESEPPEYDPNSDIIFHQTLDNEKFFSYESIILSIDVVDSFAEDNVFSIYGGQKEIIKVQYVSATPNSFFFGVMNVIQSQYRGRLDIYYDEVKIEDEFETEGYDFYIFETRMPDNLPKDGVVLLVNPEEGIPSETGINIGGSDNINGATTYLYADTEGEYHRLLRNIEEENISITKYVKTGAIPGRYETLLGCSGDPVMLVENSDDRKIVIMLFSLHYSNLPIRIDFPILIKNMFDYFMPATVLGNGYEVYEEAELFFRSDSMTVNNFDEEGELQDETYQRAEQENNRSVKIVRSIPATYTIRQDVVFGGKVKKTLTENIYYKIPALESDIWHEEYEIIHEIDNTDKTEYFKDLLIYLAAALVAILFAEWLLHVREEA